MLAKVSLPKGGGDGKKYKYLARLKECERGNQRSKRLVGDLSVAKQVLRDIASGNLWLRPVIGRIREKYVPRKVMPATSSAGRVERSIIFLRFGLTRMS